MRILHIGEYVKGGVATYLREIIKYQVEDGNEVFLCLSDHISEKEFPLCEKNIFRYSYKRSIKNIILSILTIFKYIKQIQPDIVHIHSSFAGVFARTALLLPLTKKPKIVYCAHGWSFIMQVPFWQKKIYSIIERFFSLNTDVIINISLHEQKAASSFLIPENKFLLIYNGISKELITDEQNVVLETNGKIRLLFVGRFDKQKGLDILFSLFNKEKFTCLDLIVAGENILSEQQISIPFGVTYLGWLKPSEVEIQYKLCDAVIMPSRWEGFSLVAIEALKHRKPLIASNVTSLPEIVQHQVNGYLFDNNKPEELKTILQTLDKKKLELMGEKGHETYNKHFTAEIMNKKIINCYKSLIEKSN